jgi:dUTP pyrophosphatase
VNTSPHIQIKWLVDDPLRHLPTYQTPGAAGMDIHAVEALTLEPGTRGLVPCGFAMAIPLGYEVQIRPRSGLAFKHGVTVLNAPGTIDSDYRGELKVLLVNTNSKPFSISVGDRIAQMVVAPVVQMPFEVRENLDDTTRGAGGFGHTGQGGPKTS